MPADPRARGRKARIDSGGPLRVGSTLALNAENFAYGRSARLSAVLANPPEPMKTNTEGWTLLAELPPAFALPNEFRQSLPAEVQEWLDSVERRIDGLTLDRIREEADQLLYE